MSINNSSNGVEDLTIWPETDNKAIFDDDNLHVFTAKKNH